MAVTAAVRVVRNQLLEQIPAGVYRDGVGAAVTIVFSQLRTRGIQLIWLGVISWVRWRYMDTPPISAALQVGFGGALVFVTGLLIGSG